MVFKLSIFTGFSRYSLGENMTYQEEILTIAQSNSIIGTTKKVGIRLTTVLCKEMETIWSSNLLLVVLLPTVLKATRLT